MVNRFAILLGDCVKMKLFKIRSYKLKAF